MFRIQCSHAELELDLPELDLLVRKELENLAGLAMDSHGIQGPIDMIIADDEQLLALNSTYRGKDCTTDVLSFDYRDCVTGGIGSENFELGAVAGEIYISRDRAEAQALTAGVSVCEELCRLMIHALLHLAGFDHETPEKLLIMEAETDKLLQVRRSQTVLADSVERKE